MLEATALHKFKVSLIETGKENQVKYFPDMDSIIEYLNTLRSESEEGFNEDAIQIEKLTPLDYYPDAFKNIDNKEENLWMGEFVHFHNLPNDQNTKGTLYARRFILFSYDYSFDPIKRVRKNYIAHLFIPEQKDDNQNIKENVENNEFQYKPSLAIYATDENYNNLGMVSFLVFPFEMVNISYEGIINHYIQKFADFYNPCIHLLNEE